MTTTEYKTLGKCCPIFDTEKWNDKLHNWDQKHFIKSSIPTFFHIPFPPMIGNRIEKMMKQAEGANAVEEDMLDMLFLFSDPSPFKSEMYLSVKEEVPAARNVNLSGRFYSKVFEGKYGYVPKAIKKLETYLSEKGESAKKYFVHFAYCPKCSKEAGTNYLVMFASLN